MLNVVPHSDSPRSPEELIAQIHTRSSALVGRRRRRRIVGAGALGMAVIGALVGLVVTAPTGTTTSPGVASHKIGPTQVAEAQAAFRALGSFPVNTQPPATPIGSGWRADAPSVPPELATTYSDWSGFVTAALEDFEHIDFDGSSVTLGSLQAQPNVSITFTRGPEGGKAASISTLTGTVTDPKGGIWQFSAAATPPAPGGSVILRGDCSWVTTGSTTSSTATAITQTGGCKNVVINLIETTDRYSATVSSWQSTGGTRTIVNMPNP